MNIDYFFTRKAMFKKMHLLIAVILLSINYSVMAQKASSMTVVDLPATGTDAAIGIDANKTYTHTIDFGKDGIATINGVDFLPFVDNLKSASAVKEYTSLQGYGFIVDDTRNPSVNIEANDGSGNIPSSQCDGSSIDLLTDMIYMSKAQEVGQGILITLKGLTPDTTYSVRYYYRAWNPEDPVIPRPITVSGDGGSNGVFSDSILINIDTGGAHYLDYTFVSDDSDATLKFAFWDNEGDGQGAHIYGLTCEVVPKTTGVENQPGTTPSRYELLQNYPNPFNPTTNIQLDLPESGYYSLKVFNLLGQEVAVLLNNYKSAGRYNVKFNASNLTSGIYIYQLSGSNVNLTRKMLLMK